MVILPWPVLYGNGIGLQPPLKPMVARLDVYKRQALGDPRPHRLFLGHYGVFALIALLQSTVSLGGDLLFLRVQAVHPLLFMLSGWLASLVFSFFTYTMVVSFGNVGKAIGVLMLIVQISGANAAYPVQMLQMCIRDRSKYQYPSCRHDPRPRPRTACRSRHPCGAESQR